MGLLITAAVCNDLVLSFIHEKVPQEPPLPDAVFAHTPYIPWAVTVSEYLMLASFTCMLALTVIHRHRWIILRFVDFYYKLSTLKKTEGPVIPEIFVNDKEENPENTLDKTSRLVEGSPSSGPCYILDVA